MNAGFGSSRKAVASQTTIQTDYKNVHRRPYTPLTVWCDFSACPNPGTSTECGSSYSEVWGVTQPCPPGIKSVYNVKKFLGFTYSCEEIYHEDTLFPPC
jgi:hypothetical protein